MSKELDSQIALPGLVGAPEFDRFEQAAVDKLRCHLANPENGPLMTIDENDLLIDVEELYFDRITQIFTPKNAVARFRSGELTEEGIKRSRDAGRAITRHRKVDMYVERLMTATYASDTCRALYRVAAHGGDVIQLEDDDTIETLQHRVGDYVYDLLIAGRETRLLRGAAMKRVTDKIRNKFDTDSGAQVVLTGLAGQNTMKKSQLWLGELYRISGGFDMGRITGETKAKLLFYAANRPSEFQEKNNLLQVIADLKSQSK
jgi:hypothetical protein